MKTLSQYLSDRQISQSAFAEKVEASRSFINEIAAGRKTPGLRLALRIERETGGEVTALSLSTLQKTGGRKRRHVQAPVNKRRASA